MLSPSGRRGRNRYRDGWATGRARRFHVEPAQRSTRNGGRPTGDRGRDPGTVIDESTLWSPGTGLSDEPMRAFRAFRPYPGPCVGRSIRPASGVPSCFLPGEDAKAGASPRAGRSILGGPGSTRGALRRSTMAAVHPALVRCPVEPPDPFRHDGRQERAVGRPIPAVVATEARRRAPGLQAQSAPTRRSGGQATAGKPANQPPTSGAFQRRPTVVLLSPPSCPRCRSPAGAPYGPRRGRLATRTLNPFVLGTDPNAANAIVAASRARQWKEGVLGRTAVACRLGRRQGCLIAVRHTAARDRPCPQCRASSFAQADADGCDPASRQTRHIHVVRSPGSRS